MFKIIQETMIKIGREILNIKKKYINETSRDEKHNI